MRAVDENDNEGSSDEESVVQRLAADSESDAASFVQRVEASEGTSVSGSVI